MAINVNAAGNVSPSVMEGGTAGDNKATNISFVLDPSLVSGEKFYQIQALTAQGVFDVTEYLTPEENTLSYDIPFGWSVGGGVSAVRILVTTPNGENPILWYSDPVSVTFKPNPQGKFCLQNPFALAQLVSQTKENAEKSQVAADAAEETVYSASQYEENAKQYALQAEQSANDAANQATEAANDAVNRALPLVSNALKRIVSGEIFQITDVSPLPYLSTVTVDGADQAYVAGKNLCDGVLSIGIFPGYESDGYARENLDFLPAGIYTLSFSPSIYWQSANGVTIKTRINAEGGGLAAVVVEITDPSEAWCQFRCHDAATYPVPKDVVQMQIELGETPTEFTPYVEPIVVPAGGKVQLPQGVVTVYANGAVVTIDYNRDINKAFEELTQAIISLGGNV